LPPNTQGFAPLQILNLIEGYDVARWGDASADYIHHMAEAVKVAFADREEWLTDPDFLDIPADRLIDKKSSRLIVDAIPGDVLIVRAVRRGEP
jgi:gamma-glutamyltranspeptidase/glutathione hydrolase